MSESSAIEKIREVKQKIKENTPEPIKEAARFVKRNAKELLIGAAVTVGIAASGGKEDKSYTYNPETDYQAACSYANVHLVCQLSENTLQLDSLEAVSYIGDRIYAAQHRPGLLEKMADGKYLKLGKADREKAAELIYKNIREIEETAKGVEMPELTADDQAIEGLKGHGGYKNPKFLEVVRSRSAITFEGQGDLGSIDVSVETPRGYVGRKGYSLRHDRQKDIMIHNMDIDNSLGGVSR